MKRTDSFELVDSYKDRLGQFIESNNWEELRKYLSEAQEHVINKVMKASKDSDLSIIVWHQCDMIVCKLNELINSEGTMRISTRHMN